MAAETLILGLGRSGRAAAALAVARGERVIGVDLNPNIPPIPGVELRLGPHDRSLFEQARRIVLSPGVPADQAEVQAAVKAGVEVIGELAWAASFLDEVPMAAITGTNGKSTVTWFTGQLLREAGFRPFVGGNLGNPLSHAVSARDRGEPVDRLVVEVSSYQLEWPAQLRPALGVILNLSPDHLARHGDMDGYAAAKTRLFRSMGPTDLAILPHGDPRLLRHGGQAGLRGWIGAHPGVRLEGDQARVILPAVDGLRSEIDLTLDLAGLNVPGAHNRENAAVAAMLALGLGASAEAVQRGIGRLQPLAHRMEVVLERGGVRWINDSKATNIDAARVGVEGLGQPAVVLLGGQAKGRGFDALAPLLARHRAVICFGASGPAIAEELRGVGVEGPCVASLEEAVRQARALARPGDAVLLSPGCASFDAFDDFEHRGRVFQALALDGREP